MKAAFTTVFLATLVASCAATSLPFRFPSANETTCLEGWILGDVSGHYRAGSGLITKMCVNKDYETACATPTGIVACNDHDGKCSDSDRSLDLDINPAFAAIAPGQKVQECVSAGEFQHPEAHVLAPSQGTISFVFFVAVSILTVVSCRGQASLIQLVLFFSIILTCILLTVSFFYLNAIVGVMTGCIALSLFSTKNKHAIAIGMLAIVATLCWFSFDGGLGWFLHHSRFDESLKAHDPKTPFYENLCNQYYRFAYDRPTEIKADDHNPAIKTDRICWREWIAAEMFFMILLQLLLALMVAAGGSALF